MATEKTVLITGASSGIGLACATYLAEQGFQVFGTSRNPAKLAKQQFPFRLVTLDVNDDASVQACLEEVLQETGRLDVVINNAGGGTAGALEDTTVEEVKQTFETNFFGVHRMCRAALPVMRKQGGGLIIQISSIAGRFGLPFRGVYSASKAALEAYSESMRLETEPFGIRVVLLEPGSINTPINANRSIAEAAQRPDSPYREVFDRVHDIIHQDVDGGLPPKAIAQAAARIINSPNPAVRYVVAHFIQRLSIRVNKVVSGKTWRQILRKNYRLDG